MTPRKMLTTLDLKWIRQLRYEDGLSRPAVARVIGCHRTTVRRYAPGSPGKVPNDKLHAAFEASPLTAADVARGMGWDSGRSADTSRVKRTLGLLPDRSYIRRLVDAETASLMAEAIGVAPWEVMPDEDEQVAA